MRGDKGDGLAEEVSKWVCVVSLKGLNIAKVFDTTVVKNWGWNMKFNKTFKGTLAMRTTMHELEHETKQKLEI